MSAAPSIRCAGTSDSRASSASRWLLELFWLPSTSTTSASCASSAHRLLAVLRGVADVFLRRADDVREALFSRAMIRLASSTESVVCVR